MLKNMDPLKAFITQRPEEEGESIIERLYPYYDSRAENRSKQVQASFRQIDKGIQELPFQQADEIRKAVYLACGEYEKLAFLDGVAAGAKLLLELTGR